MDGSKLPLKENRTIIAQKFLIAVAKRINSNEVIISYKDLINQEEVLRFLQCIKTGSKTLKYVDSNYWDIYMDGEFIPDFSAKDYKDQPVKLNIPTINKSLEIESIDTKKDPLKRQPVKKRQIMK